MRITAINLDPAHKPSESQYRLILTLNHILDERARQNSLVDSGRFKWNCADPTIDEKEKFIVVAEEFGEVAQALHNKRCQDGVNYNTGEKSNLRKELIQLAAVACAWAEALTP